MKNFILLFVLSLVIVSCSCEGLTKKATKKATKIGLSAVDGVAEALNESGAAVAEKVTDAAGTVAEGAGRSLERQLDEHAEHIFEVAGKTMIQGINGLDKGACGEYYDVIATEENFCSGVSLDYFAIIKTKAVVDAYFIMKEASYNFKFEFLNSNNKPVFTKTTDTKIEGNDNRKYTLVSFALNAEEESAVRKATLCKITVKEKK